MATNKGTVKKIGVGKRKATVITMRESEGWSAEPQTIERVQKVSELISKGMSRQSVQLYIRENYQVGERQARAYYSAAMKYLLPEDEDEYRKGLIQANIERLEKIIEQGMTDNQNLKIAREAISELNKMLGIGGNKVQIAKNGEGDELIQITFD